MIACLEGGLLNRLEVYVSNVLVVLDEAREDLLAIGLEVLRELSDIHDFVVFEIDRSDQDCPLDVLDLLLNVARVLQYTALCLLELIDALSALFDVLRDGQTEPVVVFETFVHEAVELVDLLREQLLLHRSQLEQGRVVGTQELVQLVDMPRVVLVLEGDIDDGVGDFLADSVQEPGLFDDDLQVGVKVDFVLSIGSSIRLFAENGSLEHLDGLNRLLVRPGSEDIGLVALGEALGDLDVRSCHLLSELEVSQDVWLLLELVNRALDTSDDAAGPGNAARLLGHVLRDGRVELVLLEELLHIV